MRDTPIYAYRDAADEQIRTVQYSTLQHLLLLTGGTYVVWQILVIAQMPARLYTASGLGLVLALTLHAFGGWLLAKNFKLAQLVWQLGVIAALAASVIAYQFPPILFVGLVLPFVSMIIADWRAALFSVLLVVGAGYGLYIYMLHFSADVLLWLAVGCVMMAVIGRTTIISLIALVRWYNDSYEQAFYEVEQARDERLELKQVQEDLLQANKEQMRLAKQLKYSNEIAEHARRVKEEFVATVSHELRTPLNMIIGFSEVIADSPRVYGVRLPTSLLADIASIQRNSQHLLELVNDVLDLSQVDSDSMAISRTWTSLSTIVNEATTSVRALFTSKGLYLKTDLPDDELSTFCDETRVREVIINLLSNAGRFTEKGGVVVKAWTEDEFRVVAVKDTGQGIAPEDQKRIFEPFQQLNAAGRRRYGGSGLGLTISRRFIEMHGGKMWVESKLGEGTTFYFSLPINLPVEPDDQSISPTRWLNPYQEYIPRLRRYKAPVLNASPRFIVLDEHDLLPHIMRRYLPNGLEVVALHTIEEVQEEIARSPAQVVLVNSPSTEQAKHVISNGELPYGTPVITCWIPGNQDYAEKLGVSRYLVKPVSREVLISELDNLGIPIRDILVVDDNPEALQLFGRILQSAGHNYRIMRAMNGRQALDLLRSHKPDVMILDLLLPEFSGFDVLKEKLIDPAILGIPVLVVSSRDPSGAPIICDRLTVARKGGFAVQDLMGSILTLSDNLSLKRWNDVPSQQ
jgi:signal transduction histidine kinase/CheY-like chemotaxis protein